MTIPLIILNHGATLERTDLRCSVIYALLQEIDDNVDLTRADLDLLHCAQNCCAPHGAFIDEEEAQLILCAIEAHKELNLPLLPGRYTEAEEGSFIDALENFLEANLGKSSAEPPNDERLVAKVNSLTSILTESEQERFKSLLDAGALVYQDRPAPLFTLRAPPSSAGQ